MNLPEDWVPRGELRFKVTSVGFGFPAPVTEPGGEQRTGYLWFERLADAVEAWKRCYPGW